MKRVISILLIAMFMICLFSFPASAEGAKLPTLCVLGDSISNGYGVDRQYRYGDLLAAELGGEYANYAVNGQTSSGLLTFIGKNSCKDFCESSDIIVLTTGGNDLIGAALKIVSEYKGTTFSDVKSAASILSNASKEEMTAMFGSESALATITAAMNGVKTNLDAIFAKLKTYCPSGEIIILTQYNPTSGESSLDLVDAAIEPVFVQLNNIIKASAETAGVTVIDIYALFDGNGLPYTGIMQADIHPSMLGHSVIFEALNDYIAENVLTKPEFTEPVTTDEATTTELPAETTVPDIGTTVPDTETTPPNAETTTQAEEEKGCTGVTAMSSILLLMVGMSTVFIVRKKV